MKTILFSRYYGVQRIRGYFYNEMRYINLRFTYLLTYLLTYTPSICLFSEVASRLSSSGVLLKVLTYLK